METPPRKLSESQHVLEPTEEMEQEDVWLSIWRAFLGEVDEREQRDWSESFIDTASVQQKKVWNQQNEAWIRHKVCIGRRPGIPLGVSLHSASPHEVTLAEEAPSW